MAASLVAELLRLQNLASAAVLAAFFALAARSLGLGVLDRGRRLPVTLARFGAGAAFLGLGAVYALFAAPRLEWSAGVLALAAGTAAVVLAGPVVRRATGRKAPPPGVVAALVQLVLLLALLLVAALTLMRAGFLSLTEDHPVLLVEVTGETRAQVVAWAPPDEPARKESLVAHRVVMRTPEGERVAEAWIYGDEVAVKGRVLRLSPLLNAAGLPNLFELRFAHNGYFTAERHNALPHQAVPLEPVGPLEVHPWWRSLQDRLIESWQAGSAGGSWAVRAATTESTFFPLVDEAGVPVRRTYRLVLTPGGLSAS